MEKSVILPGELPLSKIKKQGYKQAILRSVTWYGEVASLKALSFPQTTTDQERREGIPDN